MIHGQYPLVLPVSTGWRRSRGLESDKVKMMESGPFAYTAEERGWSVATFGLKFVISIGTAQLWRNLGKTGRSAWEAWSAYGKSRETSVCWPVGVSSKDDKVFFRPITPICEIALLCLKVPRLRQLFYIRVAIRQKWVRHSDGIIGTQKTGSTRRKTCPSATLCTTNLAYASLAFNTDLRSESLPANHKPLARS
jgi:hypothetical protein